MSKLKLKLKNKIPLKAEGKEQRRVCKQDNVKCFFFPSTDGGREELSMLWSGRNLSDF